MVLRQLVPRANQVQIADLDIGAFYLNERLIVLRGLIVGNETVGIPDDYLLARTGS